MNARNGPVCRALIAAVCVLPWFSGPIGAQDTSDSVVTPDVANPAAVESRPQNVIVLRDGRVLQGAIEDRPGGYLVEVANGSVIVPFEQVRLTAVSLLDAYEKLRRGMEQPNAADLVALARWCAAHRLYGAARDELTAALRLEPERQEARDLLVEISKVGQLDRDAESPAPPLRRTSDGFQSGSVESLGGLAPETARDFVSKVQPLVMNRCGSAGCHGAAGSSSFRLMPVRLGSSGHRVYTERNLSAVLALVDHQQPAQSPLLLAANGERPDSHHTVPAGPRAADQFRLLQTWVQAAVRDREGPSGVPVASQASRDREMSAPEPAVETSDESLLEQVLQDARPDRFDPAVFNRMVHGAAD